MSISVRRSIRWLPDPASEPTSTLVLTSLRHSYFVDVRALDNSIPPSLTIPVAPLTPFPTQTFVHRDASILDWAFAGTSESHVLPASGASAPTTSATAVQHGQSTSSLASTAPTVETGNVTSEAKSARRPSGGEAKRERQRHSSTDMNKEHQHSTDHRNTESPTHTTRHHAHRKRHARWSHWVDSRTDRPEDVVDEANVDEVGNEAIERGQMVNPDTGIVQRYEELWRDMLVLATVKAERPESHQVKVHGDSKGERSASDSRRKASDNAHEPEEGVSAQSQSLAHIALVLVAENAALSSRGMVVRVGQWCQGVLRSGNDTSCERWWCQGLPRREEGGGSGAAFSLNGGVNVTGLASSNFGAHSDWECVLRVGQGSLPCQVMWERENLAEGEEIRSGGLAWRCVERTVW